MADTMSVTRMLALGYSGVPQISEIGGGCEPLMFLIEINAEQL